MAHQQLPDYDDERDNWKAYIIKAEAYFEATCISDQAKKRALLIAALNTTTVQVLAGRVAPRKPNALTYDEVVKTLDDYFDPKRHETTESFRFFNRSQKEGEPPDTHSGTTTSAVEDILAEFEDVFQPELGVIDGPPARLLLKEGATPKFYHQPLLGLLKSDRPTPPLAAARIQRWALYLGGFRYRLQYCPGSTKTDEWTVPADVAVHVRNYGQGDTWTPRRTASVSGARMVTIDTPKGPVRRHVDQVRSAQSSPVQCEPVPENKEETEPSTKQASLQGRNINNDEQWEALLLSSYPEEQLWAVQLAENAARTQGLLAAV
ncbi:uncharacterized protein LOC119382266 [Rhipicephalus sanguineus]|uniref:uncharacterized protein LOC119382266 n=1 Tax=Rhipicephalus sanguineus TaxID=34632 RepID=UPI0020C2FF73|nr:uncharacterized protein LOC119382266 [Rhipicephalus sanguineus]